MFAEILLCPELVFQSGSKVSHVLTRCGLQRNREGSEDSTGGDLLSRGHRPIIPSVLFSVVASQTGSPQARIEGNRPLSYPFPVIYPQHLAFRGIVPSEDGRSLQFWQLAALKRVSINVFVVLLICCILWPTQWIYSFPLDTFQAAAGGQIPVYNQLF